VVPSQDAKMSFVKYVLQNGYKVPIDYVQFAREY